MWTLNGLFIYELIPKIRSPIGKADNNIFDSLLLAISLPLRMYLYMRSAGIKSWFFKSFLNFSFMAGRYFWELFLIEEKKRVKDTAFYLNQFSPFK